MEAAAVGVIAQEKRDEVSGAGAARAAGETASFRWSARERRILEALCHAALPGGHGLPGAGAPAIDRLERYTAKSIASFRDGYRALLWAIELLPVATHRARLSELDRTVAQRFLDALAHSRSHLSRSLLRAVMTPLKQAHFDSKDMFAHVGCRFGLPTVENVEKPRWLSQVMDGRDRDVVGDARDEVMELEAEVVVIGTGAGGAAAAYELARSGRAVLMLEEGDFHRRDAFTGRAMEMTQKLYREGGVTIAWGNVGIPVWAGRGVGGSTLINSGTCYRTPAHVLDRWRTRYGLPGDFSAQGLSPYYARVESMLAVTPAKMELTGGVGRVVSRGALAMGMRHHGPLRRNAPDCDGQGICCFGCPTGAKRSTDVSYVPEALARGAQLLTAAKVQRVEIVAGRARGVVGTLRSGRRFRVKAAAVIISAGTMHTPLLLRASGLSHDMIGRNLSIHPATKVMALFDETIDMSNGIPQGYCIEDLASEGIMLEGGSTPLDVTALAVPWVGGKFMELMAKFNHLATFGLMVQDVSRGRVVRDPRGLPAMIYSVGREDLARMQKGIATLCDMFRAAGAKRVFPFVAGVHEVATAADVDAFRRRKLAASDVEITAYHPLGTARVGADPDTSVCGPTHETHEVAGLYVMDGSSIPSSLGVNPQLTIMAMALRASEALAARLS